MTQKTGKGQSGKRANLLESLWEDLLSRQPVRVRTAYASLDDQEQKTILVHLERMVSEPGWQPEQRLSARAALQALIDQAK